MASQDLTPAADAAKVTAGLGRDYDLRRNTYKPYPCGIVNHPTIEACIRLHDAHALTADAVRAVRLRVAPLVLDLALFLDLAQRSGMKGIQEWLSFYFKSPQHAPTVYPENDLFIQQTKLKNTLRWMMGEDQITHLGLEYYQETAEVG